MELGRWMGRDCTVRKKNTNTEGISVIDGSSNHDNSKQILRGIFLISCQRHTVRWINYLQKLIICRKKFAAALECEGKQKRAENRSHKPQETPRIAVA
jgi:hypothetical protein